MMRSRAYIFVLLVVGSFGCKSKESLTPDDARYIRTTLALMRTKQSAPVNADTTLVKHRTDSVFAAMKTSSDKYVAYAKTLGEHPDRAMSLYDAIRDSLGIKQ
ncbi:MAG: hypothetical protein ABI444_03765 [Candidatus Kapaibacterium sp.]|jgi:hypothetical protein